ncbi:hypothetical protein NMU03_06280 [Allocoprobacillus halotolerans]|uniref:Uncharacterized protein n=1 Tax=Allocoprobacillus halotolerans TaxID=2944914 RepID=A0ABY5I4V1_9FIRM|nr:hypothetical protein [Allocoprobacillus halotolerans]UTY40384.1 hypothetical protein NMU03_06280 [Allocoprobacillus halotolerans]
MIACSLALSFITQSPIKGIGVGTIISSIMIGRLIKIWQHILQKILFHV